MLNDSKGFYKSNHGIFHTNVNLFENSLRSRKIGNDEFDRSGVLLHPARDGRRDTRSKPDVVCLHLNCSEIGTDYTESTTLHGLKYVGDGQLHMVERLFWAIAFLLGVLGAAYFISILYLKWKESPVIVSLSPVPTLLEAIPFPAITICNMNGARKSVAEPIMNRTDTSEKTLLEKKILSDWCGIPGYSNQRRNANWTTLQKFLIKISQSCSEMLVSCKWNSDTVNCNDIFNPELTDEGMCCAFNKVKRDFIYHNPRQTIGLMNYTFPHQGIDWNPEQGFPPGTQIDANPWRPHGTGRSKGLTIVLDAQVDEYFCSSTASIGFKTMLHNPVEAPRMSDMASFLMPGVESRVEIVPKITQSSPNLVNIPLVNRLCLFQNERTLRFFRTYTQRNCQLECQSNFTLNQCNCVPFYLPKDADQKICGTIDDECVNLAKAQMDEEQLLKLVNTTTEEPNTLQCACLPACVTIEYNKQMSASKLEDGFNVKSDYLHDREPAYYKENMAVVHFFFVDATFTAVEKGEIFGFTEFISSTGGLLGLFLGFSIMSAAEICYFVSLRLVCSWWRNRNRGRGEENQKWKTAPLPFHS